MIRSDFALRALILAAGLSLAACGEDAKKPEVTATNAATDSGAGSTVAIRPGTLEDFRQNVGDRVFFALDQYSLTTEAKETLTKQVAFVKQYGAATAITVEGHADERGTREYNLALGARRANTVKHFLISQGLSPKQIKTVSYGKERPEVQGSDETSWAKNRRAVTVLVNFGS